MVKDDCNYWHDYCGLCGITGDDHCRKKCKDYTPPEPEYDEDEYLIKGVST